MHHYTGQPIAPTLHSPALLLGEKVKRFAIIAVMSAVLVFAGPAFAQVVKGPDAEDTPLGPDIYGFLSVTLGILHVPIFDAAGRSRTEDMTQYDTRNELAGFPNIYAHVSLIPAFGANAFSVEFGYEVTAFKWKQDMEIKGEPVEGRAETNVSVNNVDVSVNYVRYFLTGPDRIYVLGGAGYIWQNAKAAAKSLDDTKTSGDSFTNWRANIGFGYLRLLKQTGALGFEVRGDIPLLKSTFEFKDPAGKYEVVLDSPVYLFLGMTFAIGRLK
jgi:hypothetical protein